MTLESELLAGIKKTLAKEVAPRITNIGQVQRVEDGVITLSGLSEAQLAERIYCPTKQISAMVLNLAATEVGAVVLGEFALVAEGDVFERTGEVMAVPISQETIGRVVNAVGEAIDGGAPFPAGQTMMPVDKIAPGVMARQPVNSPLQTGITAIDAMIPIGRGQRELIIGDRSTGKTAVALDTIINQQYAEHPVICLYVAIGQKRSRVAQIVDILRQQGALPYTIVVNASASDPVAMQYLAAYSATAMGEYFLNQGKDVLIVYDDLTKHAWAYRQIALVLRRPPGREAYPGDIFYLHSRLLERSCRLSEAQGGGSMTALPIVETQFGDVSAYIPTNVISITDGQIYLENEMFNAGIRPAVDPGNSVSRVGGAAQVKAMKTVSGQMRLELAQFKELEAFAQFGSADLDPHTRSRIERGRRIREILKQPEYQPLPVTTQIGLISAVSEGYLDDLPLERMGEFKEQFVAFMQTTKLPLGPALFDGFFALYSVAN